MDEKKIQEAVEFYEAFKAKQTRKSVNDDFRAEKQNNVERRGNTNPRLANLYNSLERGLEKAAAEQNGDSRVGYSGTHADPPVRNRLCGAQRPAAGGAQSARREQEGEKIRRNHLPRGRSRDANPKQL